MITYLIEVSATWAVLYLIFFFCLRKETYFELNRWYLLSSIALGLALPGLKLMAIDLFSSKDEPIIIAISQLQEIPYFLSQSITTAEVSWTVYLFMFFKIAYLLGASFFLTRLIQGLASIRKIYLQGAKQHRGQYTIVSSDQEHLPFSFFNSVFISNKAQLNNDYQDILNHELKHVKSRHTLDVLFLEIVNILLWFHPMVYLYKSALRQTHEYLADEAALSHSTKKVYGHILLKQSLSGIQIALANHFFHSHIKKRIDMMYQSKSTKSAWIKYSFAIPVVALFVILFVSQRPAIAAEQTIDEKVDYLMGTPLLSNEKESIPPVLQEKNASAEKTAEIINTYVSPITTLTSNTLNPSDTTKNDPYGDKVFKVVHQKPFYGGCTEQECSDKKLIEFLYSNLNYPNEAINNKIEGKVYLQFTVDKNGEIRDEKVVRDIGSGCGEAALDVIRKMKNGEISWQPGRNNGHAVNVMFTLPVTFSLEDKKNGIKYIKGKGPSEPVEEYFTFVTPKIEVIPDFYPNGHRPVKYTATLKNIKNSKLVDITDGTNIEPLYIIDGVEFSPEEIKNFDRTKISQLAVYKDEKAKVKYPNSGDRGVVIITTWESEKNQNIPTSGNLYEISSTDTIPTFKIQKTKPSHFSVSTKGSNNKGLVTTRDGNGIEPMYVLDGEEISPEESKLIDQSKIVSITVLKDEKARAKYPASGERGVVMISTIETIHEESSDLQLRSKSFIISKNGDKPDQQYILNGEVITENQMEAIDVDDIATINVYKGDSAEENYPKHQVKGVVEIVTKNAIKDLPLIEEEPTQRKISIEGEAENNETILEQAPLYTTAKPPLMVIDGVIKTEKIVEALSPDNIKEIKVLKGEKAKEKYGAKGIDGVLEITTKDGTKFKSNIALPIENTDKDYPLFVIDGVKKEKEKNYDIDPDDIATINVLKGEAAEAKYPGEAINGVVEIITKEGAKRNPTPPRPVPTPEETDNELESINVLKGEASAAKYPAEKIGIVDDKAMEVGVSAFALMQNIPNPWDEETSISFTLPEAGEASLRVFDIPGRVVWQYKEQLPAGSHTIRIDKSNIGNAGIYYYELQNGAHTETRKMIMSE